MKKIYKCQICEKKIYSKRVTTRSKKKLKIFYCHSCDFEYFFQEKTKNLKQDKLDSYRLSQAGLSLIKKKQDILNGSFQGKEYIKEHLKGKKKFQILDVGCSWGYFLKECKKKGHNVYGLEINKVRNNYVNEKLKIKCFENINEIKKIKFDKIFLFYSLEYIRYPQNFLQLIKNLLKLNGEIIIYTPNKNDHINQILNIDSYQKFFYEENSINYFSKKSLIKICKNLKVKYNCRLLQGYSIINFMNWHFHKKPFNTGFVGKDYFIEKLIFDINNKKSLKQKTKHLIVKFLKKINQDFKNLIVRQNISNSIILKIKC